MILQETGGMRNNPKRFFQNIQNTLYLLAEKGLTICSNSPVYQESSRGINITWPNHVSGRYNCEPSFGKILQYREIVKSGAFTCLLFEGSMVRAAFSFEDEFLVSHSLLWWPSPFLIDSSDLEVGPVLDIFDLYAASEDWHEQIQMRTPVRFDFDVKISSNDHPTSHLHMQSGKCRLFVNSPVCFNRFIKFIFRNFYPDKYKQFSFWGDLENIRLHYSTEDNQVSSKYEYFAWVLR